MDAQLKHMEKKANDIIREGNAMCAREQIGHMEFIAKRFVYENIAVRSLFHNIEAWSNLRQGDVDRLEVIQGKVLKGLFGLPKSTPYWGVLHELDLLPISLLLLYKKLMLYHNLINSDDERIAKKVIQQQEKLKHDKCWFGNVKEEAEEIGIELKEEKVKGVTKSSWKKEVKTRIRTIFEDKLKKRKEMSTKLRFLEVKGVDTYIKENTKVDIRMAMKIRLNMVEHISSNFGENGLCVLCNEPDSTEHVFICPRVENKDNVMVDYMVKGERMKEVVDLFAQTEEERRKKTIDSLITQLGVNMDVV